jgi:hypothetical protein
MGKIRSIFVRRQGVSKISATNKLFCIFKKRYDLFPVGGFRFSLSKNLSFCSERLKKIELSKWMIDELSEN